MEIGEIYRIKNKIGFVEIKEITHKYFDCAITPSHIVYAGPCITKDELKTTYLRGCRNFNNFQRLFETDEPAFTFIVDYPLDGVLGRRVTKTISGAEEIDFEIRNAIKDMKSGKITSFKLDRVKEE